MGGPGSSRWQAHTPKRQADNCQRLEINHLTREIIPRQVMADRHPYQAAIEWRNSATGRHLHQIGCVLTWEDERPLLTLFYSLTNSTTSGSRPVRYSVVLQSEACTFGGVRWYFTCPNRECGRRVRCLYRPPGGLYFACRHCHDLSYTSAQTAHYFDRAAGIGPLFGELDRSVRIVHIHSKWQQARPDSRREQRLFRRLVKLMQL